MAKRKESAADMFYDRFCEDYVLKYRDPGENGNLKISSYRIDDAGYVTLVRKKGLLGGTEYGIFTPVMRDVPAICFKRDRGLFGNGSFSAEVYKLVPEKQAFDGSTEDMDGKIWEFFDEHIRKTAYGEKRVRPFDIQSMERGETFAALRELLGNRYSDFVKYFLVPEK